MEAPSSYDLLTTYEVSDASFVELSHTQSLTRTITTKLCAHSPESHSYHATTYHTCTLYSTALDTAYRVTSTSTVFSTVSTDQHSLMLFTRPRRSLQ